MRKEGLLIGQREQMHGHFCSSFRLLGWVGRGMGVKMRGRGRRELYLHFQLSIFVFSGYIFDSR